MKRKLSLIIVGLFIVTLSRPLTASAVAQQFSISGTCMGATASGPFDGGFFLQLNAPTKLTGGKNSASIAFGPYSNGTVISVTLFGGVPGDSFPIISFTYSCTGAPVSSSNPVCASRDIIDGRLNSVCSDPAQSAALYCDLNGDGMVVLVVVDSKGYFAFHVTQHELDELLPAVQKGQLVPAVQRALIKQGMGVSLWRLDTGELQFNTPNGEIYTFGPAINGPVTFNQMCDGSVRWYHPAAWAGPITH